MNTQQYPVPYGAKQRGVALVVSLILLTILTILVLGSLRGVAMNAKMAGNSDILNRFNGMVDGEAFAQMNRFSNGGTVTDDIITEAIKQNGDAHSIDNLTTSSPITLSSSLYDLTKAPNTGDFTGQFIHGSLCDGYGVTLQCKNMLLKVSGSRNRVGNSEQSLGFGVIAPKSQGIQGIKSES